MSAVILQQFLCEDVCEIIDRKLYFMRLAEVNKKFMAKYSLSEWLFSDQSEPMQCATTDQLINYFLKFLYG